MTVWTTITSSSEPAQRDILVYRDQYERLWMDVLRDAGTAGLVTGDAFVLRRLLAGAIHWTPHWFQLDGEMSVEDLAEETLRMACSLRDGE